MLGQRQYVHRYSSLRKTILIDFGLCGLCRLSETVEKADLYSRNEALDDVATGDLKFLLARFYLGEVLMQVQARPLQVRVETAAPICLGGQLCWPFLMWASV